MTQAHKHKDGADHIWQYKGKRLYARGLVKVSYECVCGATRTVVRYARFGEQGDVDE